MRLGTFTVYSFCVVSFLFTLVSSGGKNLSPNNLRIIAIEPAEAGWPVILAADYFTQNKDDKNEAIYLWSFPSDTDQSCTVRGRIYTHPCLGQVVEHTWGTAGLHQVTLTAYFPGGSETQISRTVRIENRYSGPIVARREIRSLNMTEWIKVRDTFVLMKQKGIYDHMVYTHQFTAAYGVKKGSYRNQAHRGPAFLPWHRVYTRIFERALQVLSGDPNLGLPYWDWTIDAGMKDPTESSLWNDTYFGPDGDEDDDNIVPSGAFCSKPSKTCAGNWPLQNDLAGPYLTRELEDNYDQLPTAAQMDNILALSTYDSEPYDDTVAGSRSFRNALEGWPHTGRERKRYGRAHNGIHDWVGGSMIPYTSPNEPVFFFHHAQVDRLYYNWQVKKNCYALCYTPRDHERSITERTPGAVYRHGGWRIPGHHWSDWMYPWWVRPRDVADVSNSLKGYYYV